MTAPRADWSAECREAIAHRLAGRYPRMLEVLRPHLMANQDDALAWALLSLACMLGDLPNHADPALSRALALAPDGEEVLRTAVRVRLTQRRVAQAEQMARALIERDAQSPDNQLVLSEVLAARGQLDEAWSWIERARAARPGHVETLLQGAAVAAQRNEAALAIPMIEKATARMPELAGGWMLLAKIRIAGQEHDAALSALDTFIALLPDNAAGLTARADLLRRMKRPDDAVNTLRRLVVLRPGSADSWARYGTALLEAARKDEAGMAYKRVLSVQATFADAQNESGILHLAAGRPKQALSCFEAAARLKPERRDFVNNHEALLKEMQGTSGKRPSAASQASSGTRLEAVLAQIRKHENDHTGSGLLRAIKAQKGNTSRAAAIMQAEAGRLGLEVERITRSEYALSSGTQTRLFHQNALTTVPIQRLIAGKGVVAQRLSRQKLSVRHEQTFEDAKAALAYFRTRRRPQAVSPTDAQTAGRATVKVVSSEKAFRTAVAAALRRSDRVTVADHAEGMTLRVPVIGMKAVAAFLCEPAHVVGNGTDTVEALVAAKNGLRALSVFHPPIELDDTARSFLKRQGLTPFSMPEAGQRVPLGDEPAISKGGEAIAVLDHLHPSYAVRAVRAVAAFPGLDYGRVDFLVQDFTSPARPDNHMIVAIDTDAALTGAVFPVHGRPVNVARAILRHYFPELSAAVKEPAQRAASEKAGNPSQGILREIVRAGENDWTRLAFHPGAVSAGHSLVQEEAAKRGYEVAVERKSHFRVSKDGRTSIFSRISPDPSVVCCAIAVNKHITKILLDSCGISVPPGDVFDEFESALQYFKGREKPQVVKPLKGKGGNGVSTDISTETAFRRAWEKASAFGSDIVVEDHLEGDELRVLVLGGKVLAAVCRVPAYVIGDGKNSIATLVKRKNTRRQRNPLLSAHPIANFDGLFAAGRKLKDVPADGEYVQLASVSDVGMGGEGISVIDHVHPSILELSRKVWEAIPGATLLGLDIIVSDFSRGADPDNVCVIGVNTNPALAIPYFAAYGKPALHIPAELIDFIEAGAHDTAWRSTDPVRLDPAPAYPQNCGGDSFDRDYSLQVDLLRQAAFARNLRVKIVGRLLTVVSSERRQVGFNLVMPSMTRRIARRASNDKNWTKQLLERADISTPRGGIFPSTDPDSAWTFAEGMNAPVVVKPLSGSGGKGVSTNIRTREHFLEAWRIAAKTGPKTILVEEHFTGNDYRVLVIGNAVRAVAQRIPAYVVGDGRHSIAQLIAAKNEQRRSNPHHGAKPIELTPMMLRNLAAMGMDGGSIPEDGQNVQLHMVANIGSGGEGKDVTGDIHPGFLEIAVRVREAIYAPPHVGFDLIAEDIAKAPDEQRWTVIEVNTNPDPGLHHFPIFGTPRDVTGALIEALMPEARIGSVPRKSVSVQIDGEVQNAGYRAWLWKQAHLHALQGWVRDRRNGGLEALFGGPSNAVDQIVALLCAQGPKGSVGAKVRIVPFTGEVPSGFRILE